METIGEIIPFAKEMLNQRPGRSMLKIYMLGSTLAMLGVVGGLVETVLLPFVEQGPVEEEVGVQVPAELTVVERKKKKEKKHVQKSHAASVHPDVVETAVIEVEVKGKQLMNVGRRNSSNRLHAS